MINKSLAGKLFAGVAVVAVAGALYALSPVRVEGTQAVAQEGAAMDRAAIEGIIKDYIMNNPQVIMDSVDQYQRKAVSERSQEAIKANQDVLFKNDEAPFLGNKDGDVVMVEFFDYNCGYCKRVLPDIQALVDGDKGVKVVFKDFPILGPTSETASRYAIAAQKQGKYFEFHRAAMEHKGGPLDDAALDKIVTDLGLDLEKVKADAQSAEVSERIKKNRDLAGQLGISGTPAFVLGEKLFPGALPAAELKRIVDEHRAGAKAGTADAPAEGEEKSE